MKRLFMLFVVLLWTLPLFAGGPTLVNDSLYSPNLQRVKRFNILLPAGYDTDKKYPVLYLLHGFSGGYADWTARTHLEEYLGNYQFIVVMPDAEDSWYVDSFKDPRDKFESYMERDLPSYVQEYYKIDTTRQAIAGLSMGGYGATMLALRQPGKFFFVGGLSSALTVPEDIASRRTANPEAPLVKSLLRAFGDVDNPFRTEHDIRVLLRRSQVSRLPYFYYAVGVQDAYSTFLTAHRVFTDTLRDMGARYEYHEIPGGHTWEFWNQEIQPLLRRLNAVTTEEDIRQGRAQR